MMNKYQVLETIGEGRKIILGLFFDNLRSDICVFALTGYCGNVCMITRATATVGSCNLLLQLTYTHISKRPCE